MQPRDLVDPLSVMKCPGMSVLQFRVCHRMMIMQHRHRPAPGADANQQANDPLQRSVIFDNFEH